MPLGRRLDLSLKNPHAFPIFPFSTSRHILQNKDNRSFKVCLHYTHLTFHLSFQGFVQVLPKTFQNPAFPLAGFLGVPVRQPTQVWNLGSAFERQGALLCNASHTQARVFFARAIGRGWTGWSPPHQGPGLQKT